jgi:two-component system phosphate regulon response regulator OmpR
MTIHPAPKLLILDQDTMGENILKQMLIPNGYEVTKVNSSAEGIITSMDMEPDVIIINIMQPSENGWKLCRKIREFSQAPILVLAPVSNPNAIAHWLDAGADDYLTKPFSSEVLIAHLQKLTRRSKLAQERSSVTMFR